MEARPEDVAAPVEQTMVDAAIYRDGKRIESPASVAETARHLRDSPGAMAWIGLFRPAANQFLPVAEEFGLHELAVRGRDRRPPASEARALRRHTVRGPAGGDLPGMNFANIPELQWALGYPFALGLMFLVSFILWLVFRTRGWL